MERMAELRVVFLVLVLLASAFSAALYLRSHPLLHARLATAAGLVEGGGVLAAIVLPLIGRRKQAAWLIFGPENPGQNSDTRRWARRLRPPPIAEAASLSAKRAVDWRMEPPKGDKGG